MLIDTERAEAAGGVISGRGYKGVNQQGLLMLHGSTFWRVMSIRSVLHPVRNWLIQLSKQTGHGLIVQTVWDGVILEDIRG